MNTGGEEEEQVMREREGEFLVIILILRLDLLYILLQRVGHVTERMLLIGCLNGWGGVG